MRMRAEWEAAIARWINLRAMVIQEEKWIHLLNTRSRYGPPCDKIRDVIAMRGMDGEDRLLTDASELERAIDRHKPESGFAAPCPQL